MRLIDADALKSIKYHPLPYTHIVPEDMDAEAYERGWNDAVDVIVEDAPTIEPDPKWIPCSERLPDNDESVLISNCHGVTKAWWNGKFWSSIAVKKYMTVTAWMPLPTPYKKEIPND